MGCLRYPQQLCRADVQVGQKICEREAKNLTKGSTSRAGNREMIGDSKRFSAIKMC